MSENLEYYKVFYYAARFGSLTMAGTELSISQPAVSQALKQLESALMVKLFVRSARGIRLTPEGEILYRHVKAGYEQILLGEKKLSSMLRLDYGELRIGASDMTLKFYLLPLLEAYHEKFPGIKVTVTNAPTPETLDLLRQGKIDFGAVSMPFQAGGELSVTPVKEIEDVFVAGRRFIQYKNHMLDLQELEKLPVISLEGKTSTRSYLDGFLGKSGIRICPEFELATSDMIVQFALRGLGIGSVVKDFAAEYLEDGRLFELRFNKIIPKRQICVVRNGRTPVSHAAEEFLRTVT
ncbi:LysR family transcriptional regulator [bacterium 1xD8-48]|jgi:DNA-binding transcriptional LysR family regulator|nr:LysR family transcriptional regulator [Lachnospiraceae bacterium]MCI9327035.1 LysR family transcriptional regulator [Lachnospiraceae bacterium]NBJ99619.1 LysR family transcriptional regulator [bacterium 1xD8-48]